MYHFVYSITIKGGAKEFHGVLATIISFVIIGVILALIAKFIGRIFNSSGIFKLKSKGKILKADSMSQPS